MLNPSERRRTAAELKEGLRQSGVTATQAQEDLQFTPERLARTLALADDADPVDVWQLRDHLVEVSTRGGGQPAVFTVLTDQARRAASGWFRLRPAPSPAPARSETAWPEPAQP